jgi:hypothetical protein
MRKHTTTVICDSCGKKLTYPRHLRDVDKTTAFVIRSYCVGVDHGPLGAEKEYTELDICGKCVPNVPCDSRTMTFSQTQGLIARIRAGEFAPKKKTRQAV